MSIILSNEQFNVSVCSTEKDKANLDKYNKKSDFNKTAEPKAKKNDHPRGVRVLLSNDIMQVDFIMILGLKMDR